MKFRAGYFLTFICLLMFSNTLAYAQTVSSPSAVADLTFTTKNSVFTTTLGISGFEDVALSDLEKARKIESKTVENIDVRIIYQKRDGTAVDAGFKYSCKLLYEDSPNFTSCEKGLNTTKGINQIIIKTELPITQDYDFKIFLKTHYAEKGLKAKTTHKSMKITRVTPGALYELDVLKELRVTKKFKIPPPDSCSEIYSDCDQIILKQQAANKKAYIPLNLHLSSLNGQAHKELKVEIYAGPSEKSAVLEGRNPVFEWENKNCSVKKHERTQCEIKLTNIGRAGKYTVNVVVSDPKKLSTDIIKTFVLTIRNNWINAAFWIFAGILIFHALKFLLGYLARNARHLQAGAAHTALKEYIAELAEIPETGYDAFAKEFAEKLLAYLRSRTQRHALDLTETAQVVYNDLPKLFGDWFETYQESHALKETVEKVNIQNRLKASAQSLPDTAYTAEDIKVFNAGVDKEKLTIDVQMQKDMAATMPALLGIDSVREDAEEFTKPPTNLPDMQAIIDDLKNNRLWAGLAQFLLVTAIALASGLLILWANNETWGRTEDVFAAITWGAGINLVSEANAKKFGGFGAVLATLKKLFGG